MPGRPRLFPITATLVVLVGSTCALWQWATGRGGPPPRPAPPGHLGEVVPELVGIEPGTVVGDGPPAGWSDLVVKSTTYLEGGDVATLPLFARETATLFRTVVLADVRPSPGADSAYALYQIGVGLALSHEGQDTVITSESLESLDISLSLIDKLILERAESALSRGRLAARTATFALYDASVELADGDVHRSIYLRYALLVDPTTGDLRTFVWPVAARPSDREPPASLIALKPSLLFPCGVHVLAKRAFGKVPVAWYFAMTHLPTGRSIPLPTELRSWSILDPQTADESAELEALLRRLLVGH